MEKFYSVPTVNSFGQLPFELILAGITYPDPSYSVSRKCSNVCIIEYITSGEGRVICNGTSYNIKTGDTYILTQGSEHIYYSNKNDPWEKKWMNVAGPLCESLLELYGISGMIHFTNCNIGELFDEFFEFCEKQANLEFLNDFAAVTFHRMVQKLAENSEKKIVSTAEKAKAYIDRNIYAKINAETVAEKFGFSVSHLGRLFKQEYGVTVYSYILEQKLNVAERILRNSNVSSNKIADMLGFTDEHYFCNIFKRKRGTTPGRFRR